MAKKSNPTKSKTKTGYAGKGRTGEPSPHQSKGKAESASFGRPKRQPRTLGLAGIRPPNLVILYGRNSVRAALANDRREITELHGDRQTIAKLAGEAGFRLNKDVIAKEASDIIAALEAERVPHQSIVAVAKRLPDISIDDVLKGTKADDPASLLILDQVVDPQNVGAAMRVAAAMGALALVTQDRNVPEETGALARASAGTLDQLPWVKVSNIARTLDQLKEEGFWIAGLDGTATTSVGAAKLGSRFGLVMGSEGKGMRPNVAKHCDTLLKIPMAEGVESLNVSVAAGIALYALTDRKD